MRPCAFKSYTAILCLLVGLAGCTTVPVEEPEQSTNAAETRTVPADVKKGYARALKLMKKERYDQAETLLLDISVKAPDLAGPYTNLGIIYARTDRGPEAEKAFLRAIEIKPDNPPTYNQLGILYRESGRFKEAQAAYEKALAINPDYAYAHLNLGITLELYLQLPQQALTHYETYQQLQKKEDKQVKLWIIDLKRRLGKQP